MSFITIFPISLDTFILAIHKSCVFFFVKTPIAEIETLFQYEGIKYRQTLLQSTERYDKYNLFFSVYMDPLVFHVF